MRNEIPNGRLAKSHYLWCFALEDDRNDSRLDQRLRKPDRAGVGNYVAALLFSGKAPFVSRHDCPGSSKLWCTRSTAVASTGLAAQEGISRKGPPSRPFERKPR